ncbi:hypothetical protein MRY88_25550 [Bacillus cereus]|uniref:Uncharacterized protein n=1 Tax=Bacillus cereus (strain 03BB102) TaxID=572264 RepID=A0A158RIB2_BACC3|nr:hypothetical protein [Bacillus cereus]ACO26830.1 hypothetical protein BCA_5260 [Bacillus cereus 03BB102]AJG56314.1 hypothetical protein AS54_5186 [Bacillus cereus 03BB102]QPR80998.1 hypothetical protein I6G75_15305 [Bacillus cereus]
MYIEILEDDRRYLDLSDEKKAAAAKKKKRKRKKKRNYAVGFGITSADLVIELNMEGAAENKTLINENLHSSSKINTKSFVEITLNNGRELNS